MLDVEILGARAKVKKGGRGLLERNILDKNYEFKINKDVAG